MLTWAAFIMAACATAAVVAVAFRLGEWLRDERAGCR